MRQKLLAVLLATTLMGLSAAAEAAVNGYVTSRVNLRAGPDRDYPVVSSLRGGSVVKINGCVRNWNWCEIKSGRHRGWVSSDHLQTIYKKRRVRLVDASRYVQVPVIGFEVEDYWDDNYRGYSFYRDRDRWYDRHDRDDRDDNDHDWRDRDRDGDRWRDRH